MTVHFDAGDCEYLTLECLLDGPERPCAVIVCPIDHEDTTQECIEAHGAKAEDECWAVAWFEAGGRETLDTEDLAPVSFPVHIDFDDGVVVHNVAEDTTQTDEGER